MRERCVYMNGRSETQTQKISVIDELTSWYNDGLDKEGMVNDNTLLCPSLSTIS